jgi:hypothetical protein
MGFFAVNFALLHDWKLRAHLFSGKRNDFFARAVLLAKKLVAGKRY